MTDERLKELRENHSKAAAPECLADHVVRDALASAHCAIGELLDEVIRLRRCAMTADHLLHDAWLWLAPYSGNASIASACERIQAWRKVNTLDPTGKRREWP